MTRPRLAAVVLLTIVAACAGRGPARLELGEVTTEAGAGAPYATIARVTVRNGGGEELLLHGVRMDCGCRLAAPLPEALGGGEQVILKVRCRTLVAARTAGGELRLLSSDSDHPEASVRIPLPATPAMALDPPELYFGYVAVGSSAARDLAAPAAAAGEDTVPVAGDPALTVEQRPPRFDGRRVVRVRFTPRQPGPFRATLVLGGHEAVPVSGVAYRDVLAFPAEVTIPNEITGGAPPAIALKAVGTAALAITAVETPAGVTAELQTTTPGREFRLIVRARGGRIDAAGSILVHTSDPDEPVVTLPVRDGTA